MIHRSNKRNDTARGSIEIIRGFSVINQRGKVCNRINNVNMESRTVMELRKARWQRGCHHKAGRRVRVKWNQNRATNEGRLNL